MLCMTKLNQPESAANGSISDQTLLSKQQALRKKKKWEMSDTHKAQKKETESLYG
eukprot:m.1668585 g.1668585  ORF g.1668585 m.1668585 type:complete len:55 (+) comp153504_c0_seq1:95-259(+)